MYVLTDREKDRISLTLYILNRYIENMYVMPYGNVNV